MAKKLENYDFARHSRFTVINMMRRRSNVISLQWDVFKNTAWPEIEKLTEEARDSYNGMLEVTKAYRKSQFENVATEYSEFKTKVKFIKPDGETKWLDISEMEFEKIKKILTK